MVRFKILGIAGMFCVLALGVGVVVGRLFSTGALPTGGAATASVTQAMTQAPAQTTIATAPAATTAPAPTQLPAASTEAPTAVPAAPTAPQATAQVSYIEYTVQKGDILYTLAQKYGVTVEEILAINDIPNPQSLSVGQVIRIPKK
jgi:LysM repeat protein